MRRSHSTQAQSAVSHCRLTSPTGDCLWMKSKVSSDRLESYIKATRPVLEIFKMAGYFPDSPRTDIRRNHKKFSRHGDLATGICDLWSLLLSHFCASTLTGTVLGANLLPTKCEL
jgi:hypothetical protein